MKNAKAMKALVRFLAAGFTALLIHRAEKDINKIADAYFGSD